MYPSFANSHLQLLQSRHAPRSRYIRPSKYSLYRTYSFLFDLVPNHTVLSFTDQHLTLDRTFLSRLNSLQLPRW